MVGEATGVGVLFAARRPVSFIRSPVEDVGRFVDGGRDGLGGERGEAVGRSAALAESARVRSGAVVMAAYELYRAVVAIP